MAPPDDDDPHGSYRLEASWRSFVAVCRCGWMSPPLGSAGLAGGAWDRHRAEEAEPEDEGG